MLLPIAVAAVFFVIGVWDDSGTLIDRGQREAHDRTGMIMKISGFAVTGVVAGYLLYDQIDAPRLLMPHYGSYDIGPVYIVIAIAVIVAITSAEGVSDGLDMLAAHDNVAVLRTFSKAYGLAALRVGYAIAHPDVITVLRKVAMPFRVNGRFAARSGTPAAG